MDRLPSAAQLNELLSGFERLLGLRLEEVGVGVVRGRVAVREELKQPYGLLHGGVYASLAETLASLGTALGVAARGAHAVGMSNHTSFLRPITEGEVEVRARALHQGSTSWVWDVECRDLAGHLCAVTRMTIAVREGIPGPRGEDGAGAGSPPTG